MQGAGIRAYNFRDQLENIAFTERWLSMKTASNRTEVFKVMVDRAHMRGRNAMRLDGSEAFNRQAFIAAEARGLSDVGTSRRRITTDRLFKHGAHNGGARRLPRTGTVRSWRCVLLQARRVRPDLAPPRVSWGRLAITLNVRNCSASAG